MTTPASAAKSSLSVQYQRVAITSVDPTGGKATAQGRYSTEVSINCDYHSGAVHVIPAVGEQWVVKRIAGDWVLDRKLSFNTTVQANIIADPKQGTYQLGSTGPNSGPVNLLGSQVNVQAPLKILAAATTDRPSAATVGAGGHIFDTTLGKPIWSDGTAWKDATGTVV